MRLATLVSHSPPHMSAALDESDIQILKTYVRADLKHTLKIHSNWSIRAKVPTLLS